MHHRSHWLDPFPGGLLCAFVLILLGTPLARGADGWILTRADFSSDRVELDSLTTDTLAIVQNGQPRQIPLAELLSIARADRPAVLGSAPFAVVLSGNDRILGSPVRIAGDKLFWTHALLGEVQLPLKNVAAIVRAGQPMPASAAPRTQDVVTLVNGDSVSGIIADISNASVSIQQPDGTATPVPVESIARISFAATGAAQLSPPPRAFRLSLTDGTTLSAPFIAVSGQNVTLKTDAVTEQKLPLGSLRAIEQVNGPVTWLSNLVPTESIQTPYLEMGWPAQMDRSVDGEPIRFGQRVYEHGIGVHSYSRLTFPISEGWTTFRTQYAIAGALGYANVTVRIKLGDRVVHEQTDLRSGRISAPVVIDLDGAKSLTLEVDYGQNYDVQDRLNWIEPALLRNKPAAAPATQP